MAASSIGEAREAAEKDGVGRYVCGVGDGAPEGGGEGDGLALRRTSLNVGPSPAVHADVAVSVPRSLAVREREAPTGAGAGSAAGETSVVTDAFYVDHEVNCCEI